MRTPKKQSPTPKQEQRTTIQGSKLEVRESAGVKKLAGYAVVFNSPTDIAGQFTEIIAPGSFTRTLREDDQVMLLDHQSALLLGRRSATTLKLTQDIQGVFFELSLPNSPLGQEVYEGVRLGNWAGCSFGFQVRDDEWTQDAKGDLTRTVKDVRCLETTITAFPQYTDTTIDIRSIRAKLKRDSDANPDDDCPDADKDADGNCPDNEENRCDCECTFCEDGDCADCSDPDCDDESCEDCPATRQRNAHLELLKRRIR
jgi:HK97 family phage prohead protease